MAGIGNGSALPKLQMVAQIQDTRGRVVKAAVPDRKSWLGVDEKAVEIVQKGMSDVVNAGGGTGQSAGLSYTQLCGKTGTAQWGPKSKNQRLAWFAGFLPRENPRYSFAVLYEGRPGEKVSGGRMAAPMVKKFFEGIKDDIKDTITPPQKAVVVIEETPAAPAEEPLKALPVEEDVLEMDSPREDVLPENEVPPLRNLPELESPRRALPVGDDEVIEGAAEEP
jgi:penicillin-binding protein 2